MILVTDGAGFIDGDFVLVWQACRDELGIVLDKPAQATWKTDSIGKKSAH